jgi:FAS-associated factor 2
VRACRFHVVPRLLTRYTNHRETLANPEFVSTIADNNILLWGGDVSSLEPFSASLKLGATTYPFIAFIAVQPSRLPSSSNNNSSTRITLAILSRFSGPTQTTSQHLTTHITDTLIPRVNSFLERLKAEERSRHHDRLERAESERRAEASAAADSARIAKKREEERMRKREEEERTRQLIQKQTLEMRRRRFWYGCRESLPAEPKAGSAGVIRITLRTPAGQRVLRNFTKGDSQDDLFRWCSSTLVPTDSPPQISSDEPYDPRMEGWGFKLATSYPRVALSWQDWPTTISTIAEGALKDGGMIVMELDSGNSGPTSPIASRVSLGDSGRNLVTSRSAQQSHEDDDEYLSEED